MQAAQVACMNALKMILVGGVVLLSGCGGAPSSGVVPQPPAPIVTTQFAYVLNVVDNTISQFKLAADGSLTEIPGSLVSATNSPNLMTMDSKNGYLYLGDQSGETISQYRVNSDGTLTPISSPIATGTQPLALAQFGGFVYAMNSLDNNISQYSIGSGGVLSQVALIPTGNYPKSLSFTASGGFAYVMNSHDDTISQFSVGADGSFTALTPATVPTLGCTAGELLVGAIPGGGEALYSLSCWDNTIQSFSVGSDGQLTSMNQVSTGQGSQGMIVSGSSLYVTNAFDATISMFSIAADGSLIPLAQPTVSAGLMPDTIAIDASGQFLYVTDANSNSVLQYSIGADGMLTQVSGGGIQTGQGPTKMKIIGF